MAAMTSDSASRTSPGGRKLTVGVIVVVVLAGVAVTLLAMILMGRALSPSAGADPSPTPTAEAPATASEATSEPSASVLPTATPKPTPTPLQPDTLASVTVDDLNLRDAPSSGATSLGHLPAGARVFVVEGPKQADGFGWYQVAIVDEWRFEPSKCSDSCAEAQIGWVAGVSDRQDGWLAPSELACPADPKRDALLALDPLERLVCYSGQTLRLRGVVRTPCCGYVGAFNYEPHWIAWPTSTVYLENFGFALRFDPRDRLEDPAYGDIIRITGHFDDPAATMCSITVYAAALADDPNVKVDPQALAYVPLACRQQFVVDSIKVEGNTGERCEC